ncbi:single-stranded DNA-binding protein [Citrobacter cronae]|uniref:Single-stranded DNA-binding protein n=1 Tax=Citrobacter cronae TaxID=1748967 RepID=A0A7X1BRZ4_9ENTR|nr:single-stranded DNA-binding protein [Citrobacter cronae]EBD5844858.1 single-stranded DNA-binding protein [Salmonella enterica]EDD5452188.1 single-stranded DNA-binding protein [Salmonella enterica subsp. enterica serovar Paratyphi B]EBD6593574.1 single-stranded DNA-binding protein [Salmonella enterica]EDE4810745.1 single-stranded DNA-binding protein [Salmonella enterica subsp. enterica serovar Paratyphi B]MBC2622014.1 single-stranded DNA-binding protein [Citrobacter cronae]
MTNRGYSKVIIEGTVGREPEIRQHPTHGIYAKIYVTTSESSVEDKSGLEKITEEHYQIILLGKFADVARNHLHVGAGVYLEAQLRTRLIKEDGKERFFMDVLVNPVKGHVLRKVNVGDNKQLSSQLQKTRWQDQRQNTSHSRRPQNTNARPATPRNSPPTMGNYYLENQDEVPGSTGAYGTEIAF